MLTKDSSMCKGDTNLFVIYLITHSVLDVTFSFWPRTQQYSFAQKIYKKIANLLFCRCSLYLTVLPNFILMICCSVCLFFFFSVCLATVSLLWTVCPCLLTFFATYFHDMKKNISRFSPYNKD